MRRTGGIPVGAIPLKGKPHTTVTWSHGSPSRHKVAFIRFNGIKPDVCQRKSCFLACMHTHKRPNGEPDASFICRTRFASVRKPRRQYIRNVSIRAESFDLLIFPSSVLTPHVWPTYTPNKQAFLCSCMISCAVLPTTCNTNGLRQPDSFDMPHGNPGCTFSVGRLRYQSRSLAPWECIGIAPTLNYRCCSERIHSVDQHPQIRSKNATPGQRPLSQRPGSAYVALRSGLTDD
jgi:hypothetical protein